MCRQVGLDGFYSLQLQVPRPHKGWLTSWHTSCGGTRITRKLLAHCHVRLRVPLHPRGKGLHQADCNAVVKDVVLQHDCMANGSEYCSIANHCTGHS